MAAVSDNGNGGRQQRQTTKASDDDGTQDWAADYKGEGGGLLANNNRIRPAGQRAWNKNKEIEFTQKDFFSAIRSVRLEFSLLPKTDYPPFRFISLRCSPSCPGKKHKVEQWTLHIAKLVRSHPSLLFFLLQSQIPLDNKEKLNIKHQIKAISVYSPPSAVCLTTTRGRAAQLHTAAHHQMPPPLSNAATPPTTTTTDGDSWCGGNAAVALLAVAAVATVAVAAATVAAAMVEAAGAAKVLTLVGATMTAVTTATAMATVTVATTTATGTVAAMTVTAAKKTTIN
jgi:hypothetical protein